MAAPGEGERVATSDQSALQVEPEHGGEHTPHGSAWGWEDKSAAAVAGPIRHGLFDDGWGTGRGFGPPSRLAGGDPRGRPGAPPMMTPTCGGAPTPSAFEHSTMKTGRRRDWSRAEVEAVVADHFDMLAMEVRGESFNETEHRRHLPWLSGGRSDGAIRVQAWEHHDRPQRSRASRHRWVQAGPPLPVAALRGGAGADPQVAGSDRLSGQDHSGARGGPGVDDILRCLVHPPERREGRS